MTAPRPAPAVVATDLDGTIVRSDGTVAPRTRAALGAAETAGALVVIVTGRPPRWLSGIADATGHSGLAICANGALVWDLHRERVVATRPIAVETAQQIVVALRRELPDVHFAVETATGQFAREEGYLPRWSMDAQTLVVESSALFRQPLVKLLCRHEGMSSDDLLCRARNVIGTEIATLTHSSRDGLLEISAAGISKATALAELCAEHGHDASTVVAFGDMPNDLPMLAWAGHSVAVANAHPDVLAAVDEVTASNDEDGVALVLERWFTT